MKKVILLVIFGLIALNAKAQFSFGMQFGFYIDNSSAISAQDGTSTKGGASFNYTIKPNIGYYFTPGLVAGLKFNYTNCKYESGDALVSAKTLNSYAMNLLMGNGLESNYQSWKLSPYIRYRAYSMFNDKLGLWVELDGYYGIHTPRINGALSKENSKTIFGAELHPLVSYDIMDRYMLYCSLDFLSFSWDASVKRKTKGDVQRDTERTNTFLFQANPLVALGRAFFNIGVMKKF